jgi:hypothetical protein
MGRVNSARTPKRKEMNVCDRVCPVVTQAWLEGALSIEKRRTTLGAGDLDESSLSACRARQMAKPSRRKIASVRLLFQVLLESMLDLRGPRCQDHAQALVSLTNALKISSIEVTRKVNRDPEPGGLTE